MDFSDPPSLLSQQKVASIQLHVTSLSGHEGFKLVNYCSECLISMNIILYM